MAFIPLKIYFLMFRKLFLKSFIHINSLPNNQTLA